MVASMMSIRTAAYTAVAAWRDAMALAVLHSNTTCNVLKALVTMRLPCRNMCKQKSCMNQRHLLTFRS